MDAVPYYTQKAKEKEAFNRKIEKEVNKDYKDYDDYEEPKSFRELWHDLTARYCRTKW